MEILIARSAGFCYGVKRAIKIANRTIENGSAECFTLGPIIHNPTVVNDFERKGLKVIDNISNVRKGTVIIRSHGISKEESEYLTKKSCIKMVDTTCPFVARAKKLLERLRQGGYDIFYLGDKNHPEVKGLLSYIDNQAFVFSDPEEIPLKDYKKVGLISQTTQKLGLLEKTAHRLLPRCEELRIFNTICKTTTIRQKEALELAKKVDVMIILGGKMSSNTRKLSEICAEVLPMSYHIEKADEIKSKWFKGVKKVGITAGASTPKEQILEIINCIKEIGTGERYGHRNI
jgi:4-hydroxy-3-methylbut-2-enyl diphosphate reductase